MRASAWRTSSGTAFTWFWRRNRLPPCGQANARQARFGAPPVHCANTPSGRLQFRLLHPFAPGLGAGHQSENRLRPARRAHRYRLSRRLRSWSGPTDLSSASGSFAAVRYGRCADLSQPAGRFFSMCRPSRSGVIQSLPATNWFAIAASAGLPRANRREVQRGDRQGTIARMVAKPEIAQRLRQDGLVAETFGLDEFRAFIVAETAR
jgi:hypothetical protein